MRRAAHDTYSLDEVAQAARVPRARVEDALRATGTPAPRGWIDGGNAIALVRSLRRGMAAVPGQALPLSLMPEPRRKQAGPLALSAAAHTAFFLLLMVAASLGLLRAQDTDELVPEKTETHLVYLISPGPGGGGGGGGLKMPAPPPKAERKAEAAKPKLRSPVPKPAKRPAPPPRTPPRPTPAPPPPAPVVTPPPAPVPTPRPEPPPPPPQAVVAPVAPVAADDRDRAGLPNETPNASSNPTSQGPGSGGGVGSGKGAGIGEGDGGGIGDGSGGGTGGGPYRPGSGVLPPQLTREIRANYTEEARRRGVEGDVVLEIVVRRDGSVGSMRVLQSLGSGLEQKAKDAVRQWRFSPATRYGTPVDVLVEVSVGFKLR